MKKLFLAAHSLDIGGIETALVTLINRLSSEEKYDITLALELKQGIFLNDISPKVKIIEYKPSENKFMPLRKMINLGKRIKFIAKYKNKFDFSASFATYSLSSGFMARTASGNCALWVHADYLSLNHGDKQKTKDFFENVHHTKYRHIVFVSNEAKNSYLSIFPDQEGSTIVCNNVIDYEKIRAKSLEKVDLKKDTRVTTFLNVGRHDERQKKLTRLIEASKRLKEDGFNFKVLMIGEGKETEFYKNLVRDASLEKQIIFLGKQKNPYPYFKISDCAILTSDYEGYPVVFVEAFVLGLPIITTNVSDAKEEIEGKFGYVTEKETEDIYNHMKKFLQEGYMINKRFDCEEFNKKQIDTLEKIL